MLPALVSLVMLTGPQPADDGPAPSAKPVAAAKPGVEAKPGDRPLSAEQALKTFAVPNGYEVRLLAAEPVVIDPVAAVYDARGRLFVTEMGDYPLGPPNGGKPLGRVKLLHDRDGDGRYESADVFADGLSFATGILPWRNGLLVMCPPELLYFEDADGDGRAEIRKVLFTGFALGNPQHRPNLMTFGPDSMVHVSSSGSRGLVRYVGGMKLEAPVMLTGTDFRLDPDSGKLETVPGMAQYGIAFDDFGRRFTQTNADHIRQVPITDAAAFARIPFPPEADGVVAMSDHGGAGPCYPTSPILPRFNDFDMAGRFTSACASFVYRGELLPPIYRGAVFVAEPVHNLVHVDVLKGDGPVSVGVRPEPNRDFLTSTDPWFRPCHFTHAPDGALVICDMHRQHVEHPEWIPHSVLKRINVRAGDDRGRLWAVVPTGHRPIKPEDLAALSSEALIRRLDTRNGYIRDTIRRLLMTRVLERGDLASLERMARTATLPEARIDAFRVLIPPMPQHVRERDHKPTPPTNKSDPPDIALAKFGLRDPDPMVRREVVRLIASQMWRPRIWSSLGPELARLASDPHPLVRFEVALAGYELREVRTLRLPTFRRLAKDATDPWMRAAMSSAIMDFDDIYCCPTDEDGGPSQAAWARELVRTVLVRSPELADGVPPRVLWNRRDPGLLAAIVEGIADGHERIRKPVPLTPQLATWLNEFASSPSAELRAAAWRLAGFTSAANGDDAALAKLRGEAGRIARDPKAPIDERARAIRVAVSGPVADLEPLLGTLLTPKTPPELQRTLLETALGRHGLAAWVGVKARWGSLGPDVRRGAIVAALSRRPLRVSVMEGIESGMIEPTELDAGQRTGLLLDGDASLRERAAKKLSAIKSEDRAAVVRDHLDVCRMKGNGPRGWQLFREHCGGCHRLENAGHGAGPNLATVRGNTRERLLESILNPSHSVEPAFLGWQVVTVDGEVITGVVRAESAASVTLRLADGKERTINRGDIESMKSTGKSLMPEGMERTVGRQGLADLIAFLKGE